MTNLLNRRNFLHTLGMGAASLTLPLKSKAVDLSNMNVLFICIDDLRPQLNCYGHSQMISPNIDLLASEGLQFNRAFCQVPVCGASRASLLSGVRPTPTRFISSDAKVDDDLPGVLTLPEHFKNNGYEAISLGKVYHFMNDDFDGWSARPWRASQSQYKLEENRNIQQESATGRGVPYECADVDDSEYNDGALTNQAISYLQRFQSTGEAFFLAVGYMKPHLPFVAPQKYWDMYNYDEIDLADNPFSPLNAPEECIHSWHELRQYYGIPETGPLSNEMARTLIHGYYACTSFIDEQIGLLLDELENLGLSDNTIVLLWGDHGWNLGEHGLWCKHVNFRNCLRAPLILRIPGMQGGLQTNALTEFVDIYPSLCELCGLTLPDHLEGTSFVPLLQNPGREWKQAVFSRYYYSDTIKTDQYAYTEWNRNGHTYARMLYDHDVDIEENVNIAESPDMQETVAELSGMLHAGWQEFVPTSSSVQNAWLY